MSSFLDDLNPKQREAVVHNGGPLLIIAGAGSGKTRTITYKIAYLLKKGVKPKNILAVTFTNKAAQEMKERVFRIVPEEQTHQLNIGTFHSICARILRVWAPVLGWKRNFIIFDRKDQAGLLKEIFLELQIPKQDFAFSKVIRAISRAKDELLGPEDFCAQAEGFFQEKVCQIYRLYQRKLKDNNAFDFDDLIVKTVLLFQKEPRILKIYQKRFKHILVDEYQDTNHAQYRLINMLAREHKNICVVGDDWQSIFMFRGADFRNILRFQKDYPRAKVIFLEQNYRSTKNILETASHIIKANKLRSEKNLWTQNPRGCPVQLIRADNEMEEALFVAEKTLGLKREEGINFRDIVVLYRTNAQSRTLEEAFIQKEIPYKVVGGVKFYERKEIKDIISYLRLLVNPEEKHSFARVANVPPRGIGPARLKKLLPFQREIVLGQNHKQGRELSKIFRNLRQNIKKLALPQLVLETIKLTGYEQYLQRREKNWQERLENIQELASLASEIQASDTETALVKFLERVSLFTDAEDIEDKQNIVNLMTIHTVKGLEFPVVFLVGVEEGLLPHYLSLKSKDELEEERRLCYVAATRAKQFLFMTFASQRNIFGKVKTNSPSRFLFNIPQELIDFHEF